MKIRKRIEVEIHSERVLLVAGSHASDGLCPQCGGRAGMLTINEAAEIAHLDTNAIRRLVEAGELHSQLTPERILLVCLASLRASSE